MHTPLARSLVLPLVLAGCDGGSGGGSTETGGSVDGDGGDDDAVDGDGVDDDAANTDGADGADGADSVSGADSADSVSGADSVSSSDSATDGGDTTDDGPTTSGDTANETGNIDVDFSTNFDADESPLSENGAWAHNGLDWTTVVTSGGLAYGTQGGSNGFDDSYAYLAGTFPADHGAEAVIHLEDGVAASYAEVEILLRWRDDDHYATGYECNLAYNGQYAEIIRWPGPLGTSLGDFTWVSSGNFVGQGVHDGDVFRCEVQGNVITATLNGDVVATGTDDFFPDGGAPGIGFYWQGGPGTSHYGFTSFSAWGL